LLRAHRSLLAAPPRSSGCWMPSAYTSTGGASRCQDRGLVALIAPRGKEPSRAGGRGRPDVPSRSAGRDEAAPPCRERQGGGARIAGLK